MSHSTPSRKPEPSYEIEPKNRYFDAIRSIVAFEMCPGNTVTFTGEVDLTQIETVRRQAAGPRKPSYTAFVVKAVALALREFPYANRRVCRRSWLPFSGYTLQRFHRQDIAVASERDFPGAESVAFIDIIRDSDVLSLSAITEILHALATCDTTNNKQWREFSTIITRLPHWLSTILIRLPCFVPKLWVKYRGGAVLISSPAKYGVDGVVATWSHPLGISFGLVKSRPIVRGGELSSCPTFTLTLNFDRRVMAGAQAARFFKRIVGLLETAATSMAPYWSSADRPVARSHEGASLAAATANGA